MAYITARQSAARTSAADTADDYDAAGPSSSSGGESCGEQHACIAVCLLVAVASMLALQCSCWQLWPISLLQPGQEVCLPHTFWEC